MVLVSAKPVTTFRLPPSSSTQLQVSGCNLEVSEMATVQLSLETNHLTNSHHRYMKCWIQCSVNSFDKPVRRYNYAAFFMYILDGKPVVRRYKIQKYQEKREMAAYSSNN